MKRRKAVVRRQIFVLTPDEKRAAACVAGAFLLGLGTMYYRSHHPRPAPPPSPAEQKAAKRTAARTRTPQASPSAAAARASPSRELPREEIPQDEE